ncbi:MAG: ABC transporter substrate-binding protein [Dehalococcoidia bacterium]
MATDPRDGSVQGDLANALEVIDPLTVRFSINPGAHFHPDDQGLARPLNGEDIQRDFLRRRTEGDYLFDRVIERSDAQRDSVTLHLKAPFALLFELLGAPEASVRSGETSTAFDAPLGSGPFIPTQREGDRLALARHPLYHQQGYPRLEGVMLTRFATEGDWAASFAAGELDVWVRSGPPGPGTPARADVSRAVRPATRLRGLGLSLLGQRGDVAVRHVEAFQDQRVRRALALALNRSALLAPDSVTSGPVGPAHVADALPPDELAEHELYRWDAREARSLLSAAGQAGLEFRLQIPDVEPMRTYGQLIGDQLTAAGFEPRPQVTDLKAWQTSFGAGDFEAIVFEIGGLNTPDIGLRLHTASGVDGRFSLWGYSNPVYDAAVREALSTLNPAERAQRSRVAQRLLLDDVPAMLPISAPTEAAAIASGVRGFAFGAYDFNAGWLSAAWEHHEAPGS